jgi:lipocalin
MKNSHTLSNTIRIVIFPALLFVLAQTSVQAQTDTFLNRFQGEWQGEGKTMGMSASLHMKWEWVLGNKFVRLSLNNEMRGTSGAVQSFEGHAYYQSTGAGKYAATWFDSRGTTFPIKAHTEGEALIAFWGSPEQEEGKSTYRILESGQLEVVDSVRQKDGKWKEFGRFLVRRV